MAGAIRRESALQPGTSPEPSGTAGQPQGEQGKTRTGERRAQGSFVTLPTPTGLKPHSKPL